MEGLNIPKIKSLDLRSPEVINKEQELGSFFRKEIGRLGSVTLNALISGNKLATGKYGEWMNEYRIMKNNEDIIQKHGMSYKEFEGLYAGLYSRVGEIYKTIEDHKKEGKSVLGLEEEVKAECMTLEEDAKKIAIVVGEITEAENLRSAAAA